MQLTRLSDSLRTSGYTWLGGTAVGVLLFLVTGFVLRACWALPLPLDVIAALGLVFVVLRVHARLPASARSVLSLGSGGIAGAVTVLGVAAAAVLIIGLNVLTSAAAGPAVLGAIAEAKAILPRTPHHWMRHIIYFVVYAPVIEELSARGWVQGSMSRRVHPFFAVVAAAALFAVAHSLAAGRLVFPIGAFLSGAIFGAAVLLTGTVWSAVALHATANLLNTLLIVGGAHETIAAYRGVSIALGGGLVAAGMVGLVGVCRVIRDTRTTASPALSRSVA